GVVVRTGSVLSMGVFIGASTKVVDRETGEGFQGEVPAYSVVVPGTMPGKPARDGSATPSLYCAVIVKRVDEKTRAKTSINELLRDCAGDDRHGRPGCHRPRSHPLSFGDAGGRRRARLSRGPARG